MNIRKIAYVIVFPAAVFIGLVSAAIVLISDWISDGDKVKKTMFFLLAIAFIGCKAPDATRHTGYPGKSTIISGSIALVSGASLGLHEKISHHPWEIPSSWNKEFWDPRLSWRNKYADGEPNKGPKFPGSTTYLSWATDAKHLLGTIHRTTLFAAGVTIGIGQKRSVWHYLADAGISFVAFTIGFHAVYGTN